MRYSITYSLKRLRQSIPVIRDRVLIFNLLFVAILTLPSYMMGQVYEIYSKTTVPPPYPITLDGFAAEGGTKLQVQITSSDITRAQYPVLLKLVIKGNGITIESKSLFIHDPVFVNGNETTLLNGSDLAVFFNPDNLNFSGYSKTQYQRNGRLPEGVYSVSFELYDEFRARQNIFINVARALPGMVFMFLNEVPSLNLPMNNEVISAAGTPSINFRWTTRHSPLAATFFTPQYLFELWDVVPQGTNPYQVVRGTRPLFATTCEATYLTYGIAETPLQPGHTYAWRVREVDPEGKTMFKNDGFTDVYTFTYGLNCPAPELSADKTGISHLSVTWQADPSQKQFELRIRDKKKKNAEWYTFKSGLLSAKIDQLKPNTIYEAEVCAICGDQRSEYSNRLEITTRQNTSFNCGQVDSSKLPQNQNPLRKLSKGDVFTASTFTVEVSEASGSNGTFTGKGFILVPYLNFIKVEAKFQNIRINEEYQLIGGEVQTVYNISNSLTAKIDAIVKTIQGDGELNPYDSKPIAGKIIKVDSVKTIRVVNGQVIVTDVNGKEETATLAKDKLVVVKTQEGSQYVVDGATNTIYTSANSGQKSAGGTPAGNITTASEAGKGTTPQFNVSFLPHSLQKYGYDIPSDKSPAENYESTNITGQPTLVPWKSLEAGRTEYVMAGITGGPADSVRYYRESNNMVMTAPGTSSNVLNGKTAPGLEFKQLLLTGTAENTTDKLFAWYPSYNDDTTKTYSRILAGQLNMASYEKKTIQVVLVPVNGSICPKANYVQDELNKIYTPAIVNWQVSYLQNGIKVTLPRTNQKLLNVNDSNKNMDYTPEMKLVIDAMQENITFNPQTIYLFFFDESTDINLKGYMPLNRKFGFIFKINQYPDEYLRTIAHELGHGAFRLYHTFSDKNKFFQPQGSTDNLMDYALQNSTGLYKYQWDECHDWDLGMNWGEDEEEGETNEKGEAKLKKVNFEEVKFPDYAFDANTEKECKNYPTYKDQNDLEDGSPWVYIFENTPFNINGNVRPGKAIGKVILDSDIQARIVDNKKNPISISLIAPKELNYFVLAKETGGSKEEFGGINVISQSLSIKRNINVKIYLIKGPLEASYPTANETELANRLNQIYGVCGAKFILSKERKALKFSIDTNKNGIFDEYDLKEKNLLNQAMNTLAKEGEVSVFILNSRIECKDKSGNLVPTNGYAPLNSIYPSMLSIPYVVLSGENTNQSETLSHEIGHCVFGLQHPFDEFSGQTRGQDPQNIMDYGRNDGSCWLRAYQILKINQYEILRLWEGR